MTEPSKGGIFARDEIRVLRDAYKLELVKTDYSVTEPWEGPIVRKLEDDGVLEISVVGRILGIKSYRIARESLGLAKECYTVFEEDRFEAIEAIREALSAGKGFGTGDDVNGPLGRRP